MSDRLDNAEHVEAKAAGIFDRVVKVTGDTANRFEQLENGEMHWGSGSATPDVILGRSAAGLLAFSSGQFASLAPVNCTASTLTVTQALHANRVITLNRAAGIAVTLPAATGTGDTYIFVVGTTFTASATIAVANGTDYMRGRVFTLSDNSAAVLAYSTSNSGTLATESDTITLYTAASNTTGGTIGDIITIRDIATNVFHVIGHTQSGGTEATPFSAAV